MPVEANPLTYVDVDWQLDRSRLSCLDGLLEADRAAVVSRLVATLATAGFWSQVM